MPEKFYGVELNEDRRTCGSYHMQETMVQPFAADPHGLYWMHFDGALDHGGSIQQAQAWIRLGTDNSWSRGGANISDARRKEMGQVLCGLTAGGHVHLSSTRTIFAAAAHSFYS